MINELRLIENMDLLFECKVILYGAGYKGMAVCGNFQCAGIPVNCFCDGNSEKWGKIVGGVEIISPEQLKELDEHEEIVIIITTDREPYITQIFDNLKKLRIRTDKVLTPLGLEILFAQNANNPRISKEYRDFLLQIGKQRQEFIPYEGKIRRTKYFQKEAYTVKDILAHSPPKVGSSTIFYSLRANGLIGSHTHFFTNIHGLNPKISTLFIDMLKKCNDIKIITIVREPLSWSGAKIFQSMENVGAYGIMSSGDLFVDACTKRIEKDTFKLSDKNSSYGFEFDWFDCELKAVFGIDVFAHPFDREKGYSIIKQGNVQVLLMKLEKLNSLETVIGEYVGVPNFKLVNANEGKNKPYKYLYKNVMEVIKIPREIVSLYYDGNPRMNHFYTEEEKAMFLKKWKNNIAE